MVIERLSAEMPQAVGSKSVVQSPGRTTFHISLPQVSQRHEDEDPVRDMDSGCAVSVADIYDSSESRPWLR